MHQRATAGTPPLLLDDHAVEGLEAFGAETECRPVKTPLLGPWDATPRETRKRDAVERWGALAHNMQALHSKIDRLSAQVGALTSIVVGLALVTVSLVFATIVMLVMLSGITLTEVQSLVNDFSTWMR
jgi:hypothetical protein